MTEFPFEPEVDDPKYVFRLQSVKDLLHMRNAVGSYLAPSRHSTIASQHAEFQRRNTSLKSGRSLYNLSVWRNESLARKAFSSYSQPNKKFVLMRIPRSLIQSTSLICIDDDMLPGSAFLLFEEGDYTDGQIYGPTRLSWNNIDMTNIGWRSLNIDPEENSAHNAAALHAIDSMLYDVLSQLCAAKQAYDSASRWQWGRRAYAATVLDGLRDQWNNYLTSSNPVLYAALRRLKNKVAANDPQAEWLDCIKS